MADGIKTVEYDPDNPDNPYAEQQRFVEQLSFLFEGKPGTFIIQVIANYLGSSCAQMGVPAEVLEAAVTDMVSLTFGTYKANVEHLVELAKKNGGAH